MNKIANRGPEQAYRMFELLRKLKKRHKGVLMKYSGDTIGKIPERLFGRPTPDQDALDFTIDTLRRMAEKDDAEAVTPCV